MGIKEWAWEINWGNAILWAIGFIVAKDVILGQTRLFNLYEMFGFWITTIGEFIFVFLIVILVKPFGVRKEYTITHNKCNKKFNSLAEYNKHIKICKGK